MRPVAACGVLRRPSSKGGNSASRLKNGRSGQCPCRRWDDLPMDVAVFEGHDLYQ
jgi:hypothetical protein